MWASSLKASPKSLEGRQAGTRDLRKWSFFTTLKHRQSLSSISTDSAVMAPPITEQKYFLKDYDFMKIYGPFFLMLFSKQYRKSYLNNIYNILSVFLKSLSWAGIYKQYRPPIIRSQTKTQFHQIFHKVKKGI